MSKSRLGLSAILLCAAAGLAYSAELPEVEFCASVLVCDFQASDLPIEKGLLAAETVAAALEAAGLAHAVRPEHAVAVDWGYAFDTIELQNARKDASGPERGRTGRRSAGAVNAYGAPVAAARIKEGTAEPAAFRVEGVVALMGRTWWVKASLSDATTSEKLLSSSASADGDAGLLEASNALAAQLEAAYRSPVLEERCEALRRSVAIGDLSRAAALKRCEEMHKRWPDDLPPAAMGLFLASSAAPLAPAGEAGRRADPQAMIPWGVRTMERLPAAGPAGKRFLLRLGIGDPWELLAAAYESAGKPGEAAAVRRKAAEEGYARPVPAPAGSAIPAPPVPDATAKPAHPAGQPEK